MSTHASPSRNAAGFTLVELLVVISIITLLLSILLPTLEQVRLQARTTLCASNQRQLAIAVLTYAQDHDGDYPDRRVNLGSGLSGPEDLAYRPWRFSKASSTAGFDAHEILLDYIPPSGAQVCPASGDDWEERWEDPLGHEWGYSLIAGYQARQTYFTTPSQSVILASANYDHIPEVIPMGVDDYPRRPILGDTVQGLDSRGARNVRSPHNPDGDLPGIAARPFDTPHRIMAPIPAVNFAYPDGSVQAYTDELFTYTTDSIYSGERNLYWHIR